MRAPTRTTASHIMRWLLAAWASKSCSAAERQHPPSPDARGPLLTLSHLNAPLAPSGTVRLRLPVVDFAGGPWDPSGVCWSRWAYGLQAGQRAGVRALAPAPRDFPRAGSSLMWSTSLAGLSAFKGSPILCGWASSFRGRLRSKTRVDGKTRRGGERVCPSEDEECPVVEDHRCCAHQRWRFYSLSSDHSAGDTQYLGRYP